MKKLHFRTASWLIVATLFLITAVTAQAPKAKSKQAAASPVVLAVLNDGKLVEPIAVIKDGKLADVDLGSDDSKPATSFGTYYKAKSAYPVFFGGATDGSLTIVKSNIGTECGGATAEVAARPVKAKLKGLVMALATNFKNKNAAVPSYRRMPTPTERAEIDKLVRQEFKKNGATDAALKKLSYHNLTALDVDGDSVPEFVGSYWIAPTDAERRRLFFVAQGQPGKLSISVSDHAVVTVDDVMSGDLKDLDGGRGSELLLDVLDYDDDGVKEIFTIGQGFEGNNFYVYKRNADKWGKVFEAYRYRCGF